MTLCLQGPVKPPADYDPNTASYEADDVWRSAPDLSAGRRQGEQDGVGSWAQLAPKPDPDADRLWKQQEAERARLRAIAELDNLERIVDGIPEFAITYTNGIKVGRVRALCFDCA